MDVRGVPPGSLLIWIGSPAGVRTKNAESEEWLRSEKTSKIVKSNLYFIDWSWFPALFTKAL